MWGRSASRNGGIVVGSIASHGGSRGVGKGGECSKVETEDSEAESGGLKGQTSTSEYVNPRSA